jgi:hypothetical protein
MFAAPHLFVDFCSTLFQLVDLPVFVRKPGNPMHHLLPCQRQEEATYQLSSSAPAATYHGYRAAEPAGSSHQKDHSSFDGYRTANNYLTVCPDC